MQFSCVAVDSSGEIVSAGAQDSFEIFVWSMQTGRLLDVRAVWSPGPWTYGAGRQAGRAREVAGAQGAELGTQLHVAAAADGGFGLAFP